MHDDLLNLSRLSRSEMRFKKVNLSELSRGISEQLREGEPEHSVKFNIEDNIIVTGDERLLRIALQNPFDNAWKFTSKQLQSEISFGQIRHGDKTEYFVRDGGAGFDMAPAIEREMQNAASRRAQKHWEEALRRSEFNLANAQRIAHIGSWDLEILTDKLFWSEEIYRIFGFATNQVSTQASQ